jgi:hypothetical protein
MICASGARTHDHVDPCHVACHGLDSCRPRGSYCKYYQNPPVCQGLYYTDASKSALCTWAVDSACREAFPVTCPGFHPTITTKYPTETTRSTESTGSSATTDTPHTHGESSSSGEGTYIAEYNDSSPNPITVAVAEGPLTTGSPDNGLVVIEIGTGTE